MSPPSGSVPALRVFPILRTAETRWSDNDIYGHLNNAVYYQLFDTAINGWLAETQGPPTLAQQVRGVVAESSCRFFRELKFPQRLVVGIQVTRVGNSSVTYRVALSEADLGDDEPVAALGLWVHVYVDAATGLATPIPAAIKAVLPDPG